MAVDRHGQDDPDAFRVIAWTKAEVAKLNASIRKEVYGRKAAPCIVDERVVSHDGVQNPDDHKELAYGSSRELLIRQARQVEYLHPAYFDGIPFLCWELVTQTDDGEPAMLLAAHHLSPGLVLCAFSRSVGLDFPESP